MGGQLRAERVFVGVLGDEEAPHIAQHHQDVLIHGVDVEQVVLHLSDDAAEHPQIAPEHRGVVHQPEGMGLAARLLQDRHEGLAIVRVAAEGGIHLGAGVVERPQRASRQALDADFLGVDQKSLQDGMRIALIQVVAGDFEQAAPVEEALVDAPHHQILRAVDPLLDVLQQDLIELSHRLGGPVVAPHQLFTGAVLAVGVEAETLGQGVLQIEDQPVFTPARHAMQPGPDQLEQTFIALQLTGLEATDQPLGRHLVPAATQAGRAGDPAQHLQIAQTARAFLAVGFQRERRVLVLDMALAHFQRLGAQKGGRIEGLAHAPAEAVVKPARSAQKPTFQQRGLYGYIAIRLDDAFADGADRGTQLQPEIPTGGDEPAQHLAHVFVRRGLCAGRRRGRDEFTFRELEAAVFEVKLTLGQQDQDIDIRVREQFTPAIPPDGQQGRTTGHGRQLPESQQGRIGMTGQCTQQPLS